MSCTRDDYRRAKHIAGPASELLYEAIRPDKRGRTGLHPRVLLTGFVLTIDKGSIATATAVHQMLTTELDIEDQWDLGVRTMGKDGGVRILQMSDLYSLTRRISTMLDHSRERAGHLPDDVRYARRDVLDQIVDQVLRQTLIPRPDGSHDYALDGTAIWSAAKGAPNISVEESAVHEEEAESPTSGPVEESGSDEAEAPSSPETIEPEEKEAAGSVHESSEHRVDESDGATPGTRPITARRRRPPDAGYGKKTAKVGPRETYYGQETQVLVRVPTIGSRRSEPNLAEGLLVAPASTDIVGPALSILDRVIAAGGTIRKLLVDRHYSFKAYSRWHQALLDRNIHHVVDMHASDQGFRDWDGAKFAAGWAHCPFTPDRLGSIPTVPANATHEQRVEFELAISERMPYAAQRVTRLGPDGKVRFRCPALNGTVGCPRRAGTEAAALESGLPLVVPTSSHVWPKLCSQDTVQFTIKTDKQAIAMKVHQDHYWGSEQWQTDFARRTWVEGFFGVLKSPTATGLNHGSYQFTGLPLISLVLACAAAVTNMRLLR